MNIRRTTSSIALTAASMALGLLGVGDSPAVVSGSTPALAVYGAVVMPHGSGLTVVDTGTSNEYTVDVAPPVGVVGHASWSPDGKRIAVSRFDRRPGERVGGSDILVIAAVGGTALPIAEHDADGVLLGSPIWAADGGSVFFDYASANTSPLESRIEVAVADGTARWTIVQPGSWPAVSADGSSLSYVRPSSLTSLFDELVVVPLDGNPGRVIVPAGQFVQISSPRFSPDGREIAFVGSVSLGEARDNRVTFSHRAMYGVRAHGPPGDIWIVGLDGSAPWQRTAYEEDEPTLAWSPDGTWLAMLGGGGLYLIDHDGWRPSRRIRSGGFGGIDWR